MADVLWGLLAIGGFAGLWIVMTSLMAFWSGSEFKEPDD